MPQPRLDDSNAALRKLRTLLWELQSQIRELQLLGHEDTEMSRLGYVQMMDTLLRQRGRAERELKAMEKQKAGDGAG